jgi:hypothetical protein
MTRSCEHFLTYTGTAPMTQTGVLKTVLRSSVDRLLRYGRPDLETPTLAIESCGGASSIALHNSSVASACSGPIQANVTITIASPARRATELAMNYV